MECYIALIGVDVMYNAHFQIMVSTWFGSAWFGFDFINCMASGILLCPFHKELITGEKMSLDSC